MPKPFTRKLRNMFKRVFDNKGYKEEKEAEREKRDRITQQVKENRERMKNEVDKLLAAYQDEELAVLDRRLPRAPTRTSKRVGGRRRRKQKKTYRKR